ncbi:MAG: RloB domain-containing protein [Rhodospirillales bacterium]|nr:RloB domain-containing protein [Rhodospirillales bacterium]
MTKRFVHRARTPILFACEGDSEVAYVRFLQDILPKEPPLHLRSVNLRGGNPESMLYQADKLARGKHSDIKRKNYVLLIDADCLEEHFQSAHEIETFAREVERKHFQLVLMRPNFEGFLLRHFQNQERIFPAKAQAIRELMRFWPQYKKPPTARELHQRFTLAEVQRAALHDAEVRSLLSRIGLL